jgi:hypothetical protein
MRYTKHQIRIKKEFKIILKELGEIIMKTLLTILMVAILGTAVSANPGSKSDLLVTKDGKVLVADVKLGLFNINAKLADGNTMKINLKEVSSYTKDGEHFAKKPLYNEKKYSGTVFMKLISWRNGLGLYYFEDPALGSTDNKRYFVFKDEDTFWLEVDPKNSDSIRNFFNKI